MSDANRRKRRTGPTVESLEERKTPSTVHPMSAVHPTALVRGVGDLFLNGTVTGTFRTNPAPLPDLASSIRLTGHGKVSPLHKVTVSGAISGTGLIATGQASGTIKLTNVKGSVTLNVTGPSQPGFSSPQAGTYQFTFAKGTGAYAKELSDGTVDLSFSGNNFTLTFHGAPNRF